MDLMTLLSVVTAVVVIMVMRRWNFVILALMSPVTVTVAVAANYAMAGVTGGSKSELRRMLRTL
ncbi:hypothetical protein ABT381_23350 [Streptomyces sp. NPDC000151]|uniref:hypothetical protein n=1 Tax=Streptomyces sp. NPDC000151 TaxID=3154244 RepID=UPI00332EC13D